MPNARCSSSRCPTRHGPTRCEWIARQPIDTHVLADPGHSWKYGSSVRVAAGRDVLLEDVKDSAIAMYNRDLAVRVVERRRALADFTTLTAEGARALAARYDPELTS